MTCSHTSGIEKIERDSDGKPVGFKCPACGMWTRGSVEFIREHISKALDRIGRTAE